jgi:drug/metabolite transporter (DMT)-like permease
VVTVSFLLNFTPIIVLLLSIVFLRAFPVLLQVGGMALSLVGAYLFFLAPLSGMDLVGVAWTLLSGVGWAVYMISVGELARGGRLSTFTTTALSMFFGAVPLLVSAFLVEGLPAVSFWELAVILWLSVVNTALAFSLWNHVLRRVRAFELSVLQNTMLIQTGILATIFLGETLTTAKIAAMILVFTGVLLVQTAKPRQSQEAKGGQPSRVVS